MPNPHHQSEQSDQNISGAENIIIKPRNLNIVWGKDPRYWCLPERDDDKPAELLQVCWLEMTGISPELERGKKYQISFTISLKQEAFGWSGCPVFMMAKVGKKGKYSWKKMKPLDQMDLRFPTEIPEDEFVISVPETEDNGLEDKRLYFGLYEVWSGKWKGGLQIYHACIKEHKS